MHSANIKCAHEVRYPPPPLLPYAYRLQKREREREEGRGVGIKA